MPKREDESFLNKGEIDICPHGHYRRVCDICKNKKLINWPQMDNRVYNQRQYWDSIASHYAERYGLLSRAGRAKVKRKASKLISAAGISSEDKILELGCGTGVFTREIAQTNAFISAIDISDCMLGMAIDQGIPFNVCYWQGDAHSIDVTDGLLDRVVGFYILQYLDLDKTIPEIYRILHPGGIACFIDINAFNPLAFIKTRVPIVKRWLNISQEAVSFTPLELRQWFMRYGFKNVTVKPFGFTWGNLLVRAEKPLST